MRSGEMSERWREGRERAGTHCQRVHEDQVMHATLDLVHVHADEIRGKGWTMIPWIGMAMMVSTRLWLGGVVSLRRDRHVADALRSMVKAWCQPVAAVVVLTDGWAASPNRIRRACRENVPGVSGRGCRRWLAWPTVVIGTVIKTTAKRRVVEVIRRLTHGDAWAAVALLGTSAGGTQVNTSFSERLHATRRSRLARLTRRCRHAARTVSRLDAGMWLVGWTSNVCWPHHELSRQAARAQAIRGAVPITPAMASGRTDPVWSVRELLTVRVPPPAWVEPQRRGRPRTQGAPVAAPRRPVLRLRKGVLCASTREG